MLYILGLGVFAFSVSATAQTAAEENLPGESAIEEAETKQAAVEPSSDAVPMSIPQAAEKLIREEVDFLGAFEVEDLETGDVHQLSLDHVTEEVTTVSEDEYAVHSVFLDKDGKPRDVNVHILKVGANDYEIVDAVFVEDEAAPEPEG
ncbi:MAG: hypothetical protein A3G87_10420 [Omnitrophica bacterium RIFCSPLOWO2_12_FULL_50_11]|nr:MAG: hypothetical protein A3G87_10420 [Omnitrophica bacterium RIFCSPLOWO2_12_FULL_50_11]